MSADDAPMKHEVTVRTGLILSDHQAKGTRKEMPVPDTLVTIIGDKTFITIDPKAHPIRKLFGFYADDDDRSSKWLAYLKCQRETVVVAQINAKFQELDDDAPTWTPQLKKRKEIVHAIQKTVGIVIPEMENTEAMAMTVA